MAEGKRGRRAPAGRSAQAKVLQGVKGSNVMLVNLDVRSGVPHASLIQHKHQQKQPQQRHIFKWDSKRGVNSTIPTANNSVKPNSNSFFNNHYSHHQINTNSSSNNNKKSCKDIPYSGNNSHPPTSKSTHHSSNTSSYRETLDEPPKYDEIFSTRVYEVHHKEQPQQHQQRSYEKKPLKSYFLRHFPKPKTFNATLNNNKLHCGNPSVNQGVFASPVLGGRTSGREGYYSEIHIPLSNQHIPAYNQHIPVSNQLSNHLEGVPTSPTPSTQVGNPVGAPISGAATVGGSHPHIAQQFHPAQAGQPPTRKYTISLKPGDYQINVQWRSKTHPFRITLTPNRRNCEGEGPPPAEEQPLYYSSCEAHQEFVNQDLNTSLPRRLVHRLLFRQNSSPPLVCRFGPEEEEENTSHQEVSAMNSNLADYQLDVHQEQHQQQPAQEQQQAQQQPTHLYHQQLAPHLQLQQQVAQQQHQLLQQQVGLNPAACDRKGQKRCWEGGPRHRQRKSRYRLAERKKNEGNELYKAKEYREALQLYTQAIDLCPDCAAYYSNRSACNMMLGKYHDALNDAREAVRLDTSFVKGYIRVAKCNIALGDANAALSVLRQAGELEPTNRSIRDEMNNAQALLRCLDEVTKAADKGDYRTAVFHLDRALDQAVGCRSLKITKAEYLVFLQRFADAQEMVNEILQFDSGNADAIYVRGMCLYYQDNPDAAFNHFQHVLRLAPDHQKARVIYKKAKQLKLKKEEGNDAFKRGSFQEAYDLYTDALAIDPLNKNTNAKLYFNRATVGSKLNKLEEAVEDCTAAINLDEGYVKAYLRRAKCYQTLEKHEEAVRDYEKVTRLDRNQEHKRLLHEAKIQLKRSKRKDYYKILGVGKTASEDEIKKSYRKMALVHHPDRHANASDKDKREHEIKFKEIGEAYSVLTDTKKRAMYDRGQDINDPDGGFGHDADIDPNQIFQAFFGGHGGHGFSAHAGFPPGGFSGGSFPGGFHFQFG